tara:strand:+ start:7434 stop:8534 length:1101 start_codon:yes stop_codon:yes gene_type:complete
MVKTMSNWLSVLKHKILKDDDFIEDYGFINEADIANWFTTLEQTFEDMLRRVGLDGNPDTLEELGAMMEGSGNYKARANKKLSFNQKQLRNMGHDIATAILKTGMETFMTQYSKSLEDDSERSISNMLGSPAYNDSLEALFDTSEMLLSSVLDACYEAVRTNLDTPMEEDENDEEELLDPDTPLSQELIDMAMGATKAEIDRTKTQSISSLKSALGKAFHGDKSEIGDMIGDSIIELYNSNEMEEMISKFNGYVFQSFWIKLPMQQINMNRDERVSDQSEYTPDRKLEMEDPEEYKRRAGEFNDKYASEHIGNYNGQLKWESILSKKSGTGLSTNAGFSPAIHNLTYGEKPCKSCEDKQTKCGCEE